MRYTKFAEQADEGYYLRYATTISDKGLGEFRNLFTEYIANEKNWLFPNPLRIGFIIISSIFCKIFGNSFMALAYLSFLSYLTFIVINYHFCRRIFDKEKAMLLSILIAFSPINMAMSRRALSDSLTTLFLGLSIWLFLDAVTKDKRIIKKILFLLTFSFSILTKETCIFLAVPLLIFIVIYKTIFKGKVKWSDCLYIFIYPVFLLLLVYYFASGSLFKITEVVKVVSTTVKDNQYAILFGSGPWFRYIIDYILLSPWVAILSMGFILSYLFSKDSDEKILYFLLVFIVLFFVLNIFTKNIRYVMILDMPMRLFSVFMLKKLFENKFPKYAFILITVLVISISVFDYINFFDLFIKEGIYDPVSFSLLRAKHIIPWK
jgi:4-amino-4-deoxy-L-arabinose transferase-like glycosyltransferase